MDPQWLVWGDRIYFNFWPQIWCAAALGIKWGHLGLFSNPLFARKHYLMGAASWAGAHFLHIFGVFTLVFLHISAKSYSCFFGQYNH